MFEFLKKSKNKEYVLYAPMKGRSVPLDQVKDPAFSQGMLGQGAAIIPEDGKVYAPADGKIGKMFDTFHAVSMTADFGAEILIHVGLETSRLKGEGFTGYVKIGDKVKKGDLLLEADLDKIREEGFDITTPVLICNTDDYKSVEGRTEENISPGDEFIFINREKV